MILRFCYYSIAIVGLLLSACSSSGVSTYDYATDPAVLAQGNKLFDNNCVACHNFNTAGIGPNLAGVTEAVSHEWLQAFIRNPMEMIDGGDERAAGLYAEYKQYMPPFPMLNEVDMEALLSYMHTKKARPETATRDDWGEVIKNPIPEKIPDSGLSLVLREFAQIPATAPDGQQARINKMAPLYDGSGRLFVHDLRGKLYELIDGKPQLFLDLAGMKADFMHTPGHGTGMGSFAFHPQYAQNGLFYTSHTEQPVSAPADFALDDTLKAKLRWVLTEWKQDDPGSSTFKGTQRELLRADMITQIHGMQEIAFNPLAKAGDEDHGLLYIGIGDGGSVGERKAYLVQNKSHVWGCILRIDPLGNNSANGHYGIPASNPYAADGDDQTLGEIYAMGFRNPHRFSWDRNGRMLASCIGQHFIEELNIITKGANYGWPEREGTVRLDKNGDLGKVYPLPVNAEEDGFTYPVLQFDHDEALAICGGFVYEGTAIPALKDKYIFGGIVAGRVFMTEVAALQQGSQAPMQELSLQLEDGTPTTWPQLTDNDRSGHNRVDFRIGIDAAGELYLMTKANGKIFKVVGIAGNGMGV